MEASSNSSDIILDSLNCPSSINLTYIPDTIIAELMFYSPNVRILYSYILPIILIFGLLSNFSFLFTLFRVRSMRTITNIYLANLSIADFFVTLILGFRAIWTTANSPYVYTNPFQREEGCIILGFVAYFMYFTSIALVCLVSHERYLGICHPYTYRAFFNSKKRTAKLICATWIIAFLLAASLTPTNAVTSVTCVHWPSRKQYLDLPTTLYRCVSVSQTFLNYAYLLQAGCYIIALSATVLFYTSMIRALLKRKPMTHDKNNVQMVNNMQTMNSQVTRMLLINATTFFFCLTPYQFYGLQRVFENLSDGRLDLLTRDQSSTLFWISVTMNCVNSAINPIIYNVVNPRYRGALFEAFGCGRQ